MGVVNITPDSFSDGGSYFTPEKAIRHCLDLFEQGADMVDIGAESSRPGAASVDPAIEWQRLSPVLDKLRDLGLCRKISVDTRRDEIMLRALSYNVGWINNIEGLAREGTMRELAKDKELKYIAMHMHGTPAAMQSTPLTGNSAALEVQQKLVSYHSQLSSTGFDNDRIFLDPGIGFGKDDTTNFKLLKLSLSLAKKFQILIGVSRKSFIGRALGISDPLDRDPPSKMLELGLALGGIQMIRTHQVGVLHTMLSQSNLEQ